jgi:hypothetical protein
MLVLTSISRTAWALVVSALGAGPLAPPASAAINQSWDIGSIEPATLAEASRVLWWRDSIGMVFGSNAADDAGLASLDAMHVGGAWRLPVEHGIDLTLRSELVGTRTSVEAWRSGATWSVDLAPNASLSASAWWSLPQADETGGPASPDGEGSAHVGFTLRF